MFFGREDDFSYVVKKIGEDRSNQIMVLCGERRSGKTSILFQILDGRLGEGFLPVLIDMQMLAGIKGDADFFRAILKAGSSLAGGEGPDAPDAGPTGTGVEGLLEAFLSETQRRSPGKTVLFLLDEYELIEAKIRDGSLSESTIHYLAGILESPYRVSFIFTGSTNLEDRRVEIWKSLLGKSIYRKISYLSRGDTARLITEPVRESVDYPAQMVEAIFRLTGGQPFYTQVICQNMVDLLMEEQRNDPRPPDLEKIVRDIVDNPLPQMIYSWNSLAEWSQVILASLASRLPDPSSWAGAPSVRRFLQRSRVVLPFKRERINVLLEEAYHKEFLEKDDRSSYRFRMDLLRRWISREHSIWKVAREAGLEFRKARRTLALTGAIVVPVLGLAALVWFLLVPRLVPSVRPGPSPQASPIPVAVAAQLTDIVFTANRGPFRLNIDGEASLTSEGQRDPKTIHVKTLAPGKHIIVATPRDGAPVTYTVEVSRAGQTIDLNFTIAAQKPGSTTSGSTSAAAAQKPGSSTAEAAASSASAPMVVENAAVEEAASLPPETSTEAPAAEATTPSSAPEQPAAESAAIPVAEAEVGDLVISSKPPDAAVFIDGAATGKKTPFIQKLAAGEHAVMVSLEGFRTSSATVVVGKAQELQQNFVLEEAWAEITFDVRPTAQIYLDNVHILDTPFAKPWKVRAGSHVVTIKNEALLVDITVPIKVVEGQAQTITKVLK
jgi:AAA+ ATPase superfamily predicted ATPase